MRHLASPPDETLGFPSLAGLFCLLGFFLHIALSGPLLEAFGFHYTADEGAVYQKIHPGTLCIYLSFLLLLWQHGNPLARAFVVYRRERAASWLLLIYIIAFCYMLLRSGSGGITVILDTHITAPLCVLVLAFTPTRTCRIAVALFIAMAALNSAIGIAEAASKSRLFAFDATWDVLHEDYFRASALRGHPLTNAAFTSVAIFVLLALRWRVLHKVTLLVLFLTALVAFGGRSGLVLSVLGLAVLGAAKAFALLASRRLTLLQAICMAISLLVVPAATLGGLYGAINSGLGERLSAHAQWDNSATARELAPLVLDDMRDEEKWLGISNERIDDITYRVNLRVPLAFIENPWLLMFMRMGAVLFSLWLIATMAFIIRLMRGTPLSLKLAVLMYFAISTTYNSFGTKDSTYMIMVCAVVCAARTLKQPPRNSVGFSAGTG